MYIYYHSASNKVEPMSWPSTNQVAVDVTS